MNPQLLERVKTTEFSLVAIFIAGFTALAVTSDGVLLSQRSLQGFLTFLAIPILIGLAQMVVLSVGQLNLAVGSMGGSASAFMAVMLADHGWPVWLALVTGFVAATLMGVLNGALVIGTRLNGFIITLGTLTALIGVQYQFVRSFTVDAYSPALKTFGRQNILGIPYIFLIALATAGLVAFFYKRTVLGRELLATGGNPEAARLSGISNARSIFVAHVLSGALVGVASLVTIASLPGINRSIGGDWLLPSFAAPIIGGVAMSGGNVAAFGTVMAAGVVRLVDIARAQYSLDPSIVNFTVGAVVLSTVALSEWRRRRNEEQRIVGGDI